MVGNANVFNGVKVFSATTAHDRASLGDRLTAWMQANPARRIVDTVTLQSSDEAFHCLSITVFYVDPPGPGQPPP
jgi:hypothetical protein